MRRVLNHKSERRWRASVRLGKRSKRFSVGKETKEEKGRYRQYKANRERTAPAPHLWAPDAITAILSKCCEEGRDYLSLKLDDPSFNAPIYANLFDDEDGEGYTLIWSRPRKNND